MLRFIKTLSSLLLIISTIGFPQTVMANPAISVAVRHTPFNLTNSGLGFMAVAILFLPICS